MEGTQVTDASSTSSTREAINLLSTAMAQLTSEMSQLRKQQNNLHSSLPHQQDIPQTQYCPPVHSYGGIPPPPMTQNFTPTFVSRPPSSALPLRSSHPRRDPQREKSKKAFYGVRNGLNGNGVYSSWPACAKDVFNMSTQSYYPGTIFRGFDSYTLAYLFSIGVDEPVNDLRTDTSIPEPSPYSEDDTYVELSPPFVKESHYEQSTQLQNSQVPSDVSYSHQSNISTASDFHASIMKDRNLPKYSGKEDLSIFLHKLKPVLDRPDINNCHLDHGTTPDNAHYSSNLATLLWVCLEDDALAPFVNNDSFTNKGIEMLHTLQSNAYPKSRSAANAIMSNLHTIKIQPQETFEQFGKRLRTLYTTCLQNGYQNDPMFLPRCFINGLDSNFDMTREMIQHGSLDWSHYTLTECIHQANMIKLNLLTANKWKEHKASAAPAGKQGALRPQQSQATITSTPDPDIPTYCLKENLSPHDVERVMKRYNCFLCRRQNHSFHDCGIAKRFYKITPVSDVASTPRPTRNNNTNTSSRPTPNPAANLASLPVTVQDSSTRYNGFEDIQTQAATDAQPQTNYDSPVDTDNEVADNTTNNSTVSPYSFRHCRGSAKRIKYSTHIDPLYFLSPNQKHSHNCIVDSGATHHMWNDPSAFISFYPEENGGYVRIANNQKIPIVGYGTIRVKLDNYVIELEDVFYVPSLRDSLFSVRQHRRCDRCSFICDNNGCHLHFPLFSIPVPDHEEMVVSIHSIGTSSNKIHWSSPPKHTANIATVGTNSPTPQPRPSDKPNPTHTSHRRISNQELYRYLGFRQLTNLNHFKSCIKDTVTIINTGEIPKDISQFATITRQKHNKNPIPRPDKFFDVAHMDIGYGDTVAPGGYKYVLLIVDRKTRFSYVFGLKNTKADSILTALKELKVSAGCLPRTLYTDFDPKILSRPVINFCLDNQTDLLACPEGQQNQNGLVERKWQTLVHMARRYMTDKQMPRNYWFWAIRHANRVSNLFPLKCNDVITTSFELVYGVKPDYRQLFRLFSTAYLSHSKDNTHQRTTTEPHSLQGIAVGYSDRANGMEIYNPNSKQLYTTTVYRLDEQNETRNHFNLHYDGSMYFGLYSSMSNMREPEPYPPGTQVRFQHPNEKPINGFVTAVPDNKFHNDTGHYTIRLDNGAVESVPASLLPSLTNFSDSSQPSSPFPAWIKHGEKCSMEYNNQQLTGLFHHSSDDTWEFHETNRSGVIKHKYPLPNLRKTYHSLINLGILRPGWTSQSFVPTAYHVSAKNLTNPCPSNLKQALDPTNPDCHTWQLAYEEEFHGIYNCAVYDVISHDEYESYRKKGVTAIPTMCILTIKNKDGHPDRAKSRIVVLGNQDKTYYSKSDKYAPVLSQNQLRVLVALAVSKRRRLRQGDVKNAFCNGILPDDETVICMPPKNCPLSKPHTYWRLKKTLYGLAKSPRHWFSTMEKVLHDIGLRNTPNSPCVFTGRLSPDTAPIYVGLYVDDFCYFSEDDKVEERFRQALEQHFTLTWEPELDWFLGIRFHWKCDDKGLITKCHLSQEAFIQDLLARTHLLNCNTSPRATPFRRGLPVDTVTDALDLNDPSLYTPQRTKSFQEIMGCLNWLSISTRPDITTIVTLLASHQAQPLQGHLNAALHVVRYLASTLDHGITFSYDANGQLQSFLHFPLLRDLLTGFSDSNWGPMDASKPKASSPPVERLPDSFKSVSGSIIMLSNGPVSWGAQRQDLTALSSCEAEINATNETVKSILELRILLRDLDLPLDSLVPVYNDNQGAVDWCKGTITKKTRHIDLQENHVKENLEKTIRLNHIPGKTNLADIFTKEYKDSSFYLQLRDLLVPSLSGF